MYRSANYLLIDLHHDPNIRDVFQIIRKSQLFTQKGERPIGIKVCKGNRLLFPTEQSAHLNGSIRCRESLGGLLTFYHRQVA